MSQAIFAPNADCVFGTVDRLDALIWRREDGELKWCWLSGDVELLRTHDGKYVGICDHEHKTVSPITWRPLDPTKKLVLINQIHYLSQGDNERPQSRATEDIFP